MITFILIAALFLAVSATYSQTPSGTQQVCWSTSTAARINRTTSITSGIRWAVHGLTHPGTSECWS